MNIAILMEHHLQDQIGGAELQCHYLAEAFMGSGHEVVYYTLRKRQGAGTGQAGDCGYEIVRVGDSRILKLISLYNAMKKRKTDVIYVRTINYVALACLLKVLLRCRFVYGMSSITRCEKLSLKFWQVYHEHTIRYLKQAMKHNFNFLFYRFADRIVSQTMEQQQLLKKGCGLDSVVIYNGHPVSPNVTFDKSDNTLEIIWVGKESKAKRLDLFIDLARHYRKKGVRWTIACKVTKGSFESKVRKAIAGLENVFFYPNVAQERVCSMLESASLMVNTSLVEGFSNTFIEAWLRGVPILSYSNDPDGLLAKHKIGFCAGSSWDDFVQQFEHLVSNPDILREMGRRARRFAASTFDIKRNAKMLEAEMEKVVLGE